MELTNSILFDTLGDIYYESTFNSALIDTRDWINNDTVDVVLYMYVNELETL